MAYKSLFELDNSWVNSTISSGTSKSEDLIHTFLNFLADHSETLANEITEEWLDVIKGILSVDDVERDYEQELEFLSHLFDVMDAISPEGCMFGSHESDGALYGFWKWEDE